MNERDPSYFVSTIGADDQVMQGAMAPVTS